MFAYQWIRLTVSAGKKGLCGFDVEDGPGNLLHDAFVEMTATRLKARVALRPANGVTVGQVLHPR
jgi:hypothetical protein